MKFPPDPCLKLADIVFLQSSGFILLLPSYVTSSIKIRGARSSSRHASSNHDTTSDVSLYDLAHEHISSAVNLRLICQSGTFSAHLVAFKCKFQSGPVILTLRRCLHIVESSPLLAKSSLNTGLNTFSPVEIDGEVTDYCFGFFLFTALTMFLSSAVVVVLDRPAQCLFSQYRRSFFLFLDIPNCCIGCVQCLCNGSDRFLLFLRFQMACFSPTVSSLLFMLLCPFYNRFFLHKWNQRLKQRVNIQGSLMIKQSN